MERVDGRRLSIAALNERRRRAVKIRLSGATIQQTVSQCELGRVTVIHAMQAYERGGWKAVEVAPPGRRLGSGRMLTPEMEKQVQWLIRDRTPDQLKMNYALWTRQAVSELIEARWGLRLPVRSMGKYLLASPE